MGSREKFKTAFSTKSKNRERLARRAEKVRKELASITETIEGWKADGVNDGWKPYAEQLKELQSDLDEQLTAGEDNPATAYRALADTKKMARDVVVEVRRNRPMVVDVPGVDLTLNSQIIPDFGSLSPEEREQKVLLIGEKVAMGKVIMEALVRDPEEAMRMIDEHGPPSREDLAAVSWFLRAQAEEVSGDAWRKGALTIPDPDGHVRAYLDKCSEVYGRDSSHLKKDQSEHHGQARGIDFYEGEDDDELLLPYGMRALLFQRFERDGQERLYVKMETESARFNPKFRRREETPEARALQSADVGRSILHLKNLLIKEKDKSGLARHAEKYGDIPKMIRQAYDALRDAASNYPGMKKILDEGGKSKRKKKLGVLPIGDKYLAIEVQQMAANVQEIRLLVQQLGDNEKALEMLGVDMDFVDEARDLLAQWDLLIKDAWGEDAEDQIALRIGDEVILELEDIVEFPKDDGGPPDPADIEYGNLGNPNPFLYFQPNNANGFNFRVDSDDPGGPWIRVEQFCAFLAATWLTSGAGPGGLAFSGLGNRDAAVQTVRHWAGNGGAAGQVRWASRQIGGRAVPTTTVMTNAGNGSYRAGTRIWFGTNVHAMAAVVLPDGNHLVYDPNTGGTQTLTGAQFAANPSGANVWVVSGVVASPEDALGMLNQCVADVENCHHTDELDDLREVLMDCRSAIREATTSDGVKDNKTVQSTVKLLHGKLPPLERLIAMLEVEEGDETDVLGMLNEQISVVEGCQHTDDLEDLQQVLRTSESAIKQVRKKRTLMAVPVVQSTVLLLEERIQPLGRLIAKMESES